MLLSYASPWASKLQCCFLRTPNGGQSCIAASSGPAFGIKAAALLSYGSLWGSKLPLLHPHDPQWRSKLQHFFLMAPYGDQSCNAAFLCLSMCIKAAMLLFSASLWGSKLQCFILRTPNGDQSCSTCFSWLQMGFKAAMLHPQDPQWGPNLHCCTLMTPNEAPKPAPLLSTPPCSQDPHHHPCQPNPDPTPPPTTPSPPTHLLLLPLHPWSPR